MADTDILDPSALLGALADGEQHARLEPSTEAMVAEALRTRCPGNLKAARTWLAVEAHDSKRARRSPPPRLVELRKQVSAAIAELAVTPRPERCPHCGQTISQARRVRA